MKFEIQKMVKWYNVGLLASTGAKTVISAIFGNFADRREMQAALSQEVSFDCDGGDEMWVDYISDLGDGFNPTYTMAHLLAQEQLHVNGTDLPRASILIMGGDQVYPTPEKKEYHNRLQGPYHAAFPKVPKTSYAQESQARGLASSNFAPSSGHPYLFAIPGNHDWYDGLSNFMKIFCQQRSLGNWQTIQKRSYFALKLPHGCWVWGVDVQLKSDIDKPQLEYFEQVAKQMREGDYVILCTAEPSWVYHSIDAQNDSYTKLNFFVEKVLKNRPSSNQNPVAIILTGDMHHYSRYEVRDGNGNSLRQLITAGGGGAFLHPTHFLKDEIHFDDNERMCTPEGGSACLAKAFPPKSTSKKLAFKNLLFPFYNQLFPLTLGFAFMMVAWLLQTASPSSVDGNGGIIYLMQQLSQTTNIGAMLAAIWGALQQSPFAAMLNALMAAGFVFFADTKSEYGKWCYVASGLLALVQLLGFYCLFWFFSWLNISYLHLAPGNGWQILLFVFEMGIIGSIVSSMLFGIYLLTTNLWLKAHPTEAFSSFRDINYKNFIRLHITKKGVTIYPIGVEKVPTNWKNVGHDENAPRFEGGPVPYDLIEPPISVKVK